jgi:putative Mg2+ transporter-C (MgtC) family protein
VVYETLMVMDLVPHTEWHAILRLIVAALAGGAIGLNRGMKGKPAGLRTHMLVSVGAALFGLIPLLVAQAEAAQTLGRVIQGVATGIGFLGAGEIIHQLRRESERPLVYGLTSAAAIWLTAAIGMAAACGLWMITALTVVLALVILSGAERLEGRFPSVRQG